MAIRTTCPSCRTVYNLADQLAGKTVRCKKCEAAIVVRAAGEQEKVQTRPPASKRSLVRDEGEEARPRRRIREEEDDDDDEDLPLPIRRSNHGLIIGLIAGGVGLMLLLAGGIVVVVLLLRIDRSGSGNRAPDFRADAGRGEKILPVQAGRANQVPDFPAEDDDLPGADPVTRALHQLKSPNPFKRHEALRTLKNTPLDEGRRAEVIKALEPLLNDADHFTRSDAMKALARFKDERLAEPIAQHLEEFEDLLDAAEALKMMGPAAEKAVLARLNHHEIQVRIMVCEILKVIGTKQSIPALDKVVAAGKDPFSGADHLVAMQAEQTIKSIKARP
jgi:predicted Zn finger-like uncharacterized protein